MSRWEPGARSRLQAAAVELFLERGFEQTTVAEIAKRAGLTEHTFFRYFADKREGSPLDVLVRAVDEAAPSLAPIDAGAAIEVVAALFDGGHEHARFYARALSLRTRSCRNASSSRWHHCARHSPRRCAGGALRTT